MIAQSVAEILADHVKLSVEGIDRLYLNVYVPRLQKEQRLICAATLPGCPAPMQNKFLRPLLILTKLRIAQHVCAEFIERLPNQLPLSCLRIRLACRSIPHAHLQSATTWLVAVLPGLRVPSALMD
jgi:hypothetical protein